MFRLHIQIVVYLHMHCIVLHFIEVHHITLLQFPLPLTSHYPYIALHFKYSYNSITNPLHYNYNSTTIPVHCTTIQLQINYNCKSITIAFPCITLHEYMHTCVHAHMRTCTHAYMHTCMHICTCKLCHIIYLYLYHVSIVAYTSV